MKTNMGTIDRAIRAGVVAPALIVIAVVVAGATSALGIILLALAAVMLLTSAVGYCPLYAPLHLSTCRRTARA